MLVNIKCSQWKTETDTTGHSKGIKKRTKTMKEIRGFHNKTRIY